MKNPIYTGLWGSCHIQGIAADLKNGYIYYSFTTKLVKATLDGKTVGSLDGLVGHLGCIAYNEADGCVYGSLEYKNDSIGRGILKNIGASGEFDDGFYVAKFDVSKIDRLDMSAEDSGIMTCAYLSEVVSDYNASVTDREGKRHLHRYGCSGIDGLTIAPLPDGDSESERYLYVAYGIYSDTERCDNDHQILLAYDISELSRFFKPLRQTDMHKSGPKAPGRKFFVYTGNTTYGVQNLEYDSYTNALFMAVYTGKKESFPNFSLFAVDLKKAPKKSMLSGLSEEGELLSLCECGKHDKKSGVFGWNFPYGSTGLFSYGDGRWLISENAVVDGEQCSYIHKYTWDEKSPFIK